MCHKESIDGFKIIAHKPNENDVSRSIRGIKEIFEKQKKVYLGPNSKSSVTESEFVEQCTAYFERYCKRLAEEGPLILPGKVTFDYSKNLVKLTPVMRRWCEETNDASTGIRGLVLQSFSILKHLDWYGFNENVTKQYLQVDNISEELSTIVYNPMLRAVLLLRKGKSNKLASEIASALNYLKLFILLFHNELNNSCMKLIPLVVTDENFHPGDGNCDLCINHVLSEKELANVSNWLEGKEKYFEIEHRKKIEERLSEAFLAKVAGVLAAARIHSNYVPVFIDDQNDNKQMEHMSVLLTPEQMGIFYSQDKHMIIKGGFGCGKSIIAAVILEKIEESLKNDEKLFHICYDARSELLNKMVKYNQENYKVKPFLNRDRLRLSEIIDQITKPDRSEKINFVIDEYDGEDLDEFEAEKLNNIFSNLLKEAYIVLIVQPIEKERVINNIHQKRNRFDLLEKTMTTHHLTLNVRNSKEIHELVEATKEVLKEKQTVFIDSKDSEIGDETEERKESKTSNKREENQESKESLEENSVSKEEVLKYEDHQELEDEPKCEGEDSSSDELEVEQELEIEWQAEANYNHPEMVLDGDEVIKASPTINSQNNKDGLTQDHKDVEVEAEYESKAHSVKNSADYIIGLDDAQAIIGSSVGNDTGGKSTVSKFTHAEVDNIGHEIKTAKPLLFELGDKEEFEKRLSLIAIFKKLLTINDKHVVLHLDNAIPSALSFAFDHYFSDIKKTTSYKEFQSSNKSVFICSYPRFRGLEYSRVTVLIDRDIYFVQHYLVEMLSRCTSELFVVVLQNSSALNNVIEKWKTKELINQWKTEISKKDNQNKDSQFRFYNERRIIEGKLKSKYYMSLEEKFESSRFNNKITASNRKREELEAREIIKQR